MSRTWNIEPPAVRLAVHTGPVVLGSMDMRGSAQPAAFGDTLNTAARIQTAARPNTVLVGESTKRLVDPLFEWGELQALTLKGKSAPVVAYEARAVLAAPGRLRRLAGIRTQFVGREAELARAWDAPEDLAGGAGGILVILGEPGIGKSRLALELRALTDGAASPRGLPLWLEGRCVSYGESLPYWPYRELLREWLGLEASATELRVRLSLAREAGRLFGERAPEITPYLGELLGVTLEPEAAARLGQLSPEARQYRTFEVVRLLLERLAHAHPVIAAIEDLHWADPTSVQLTESLLALTETAPLLLLLTQRPERDHASWGLKEVAEREYPHRTRAIMLEPLSGEADRELLASLVGGAALPGELEARILAQAEGNPFYLEEIVRSLMDAGALVREGEQWRFDHAAPVEIPPTVEKVIIARLDRLNPRSREVLTAASILGRRFTLPHLRAVAEGDGTVRDALHELQRLDLLRAGRTWPVPEYRFKHTLIQEAAYRTLLTPARTALHRRAAEWLEREYSANPDEVLGLLAHHWHAAADEDKAAAYLARAGDRARREYALDEAIGHYRALLPLLERRGDRRGMAVVLFKLALALHMSLRFAEANAVYQQGFEYWTPPEPWPGEPTAVLRMARSAMPFDPDPSRTHYLSNIQLCMAMYDRLVERWPEATIVPSLAERWEISEDGLRYLFHLRPDLRWSDGAPLTAHDVVFAVRRMLDPDAPRASVAIYFVVENGLDYYLRRHRDEHRIGVRALDDRTVEFRLVAPAPYFMSVVNRPDSGPLPRHAIERYGEDWLDLERQVVSGPFRRVEWSPQRVVLERRPDYTHPRPGNVGRVEITPASPEGTAAAYHRGEIDLVDVRADDLGRFGTLPADEIHPGPPAFGIYLAFDHAHPGLSRADLRLALAHAIDREALERTLPSYVTAATGGVVPPPLQGHTPDIAPRFDPALARQYAGRSGWKDELRIAAAALPIYEMVLPFLAQTWREVLRLTVDVHLLLPAEWSRLDEWRTAAPLFLGGWFPGYPDPEYYLRLLLHSTAKDNWGRYAYPPFDDLIERARQERSDRARLELFHQADRMAVAEQAALIPLLYESNVAVVKPWVRGWWEFGKSWASFADLIVDEPGS